jgi:hypothetical protein
MSILTLFLKCALFRGTQTPQRCGKTQLKRKAGEMKKLVVLGLLAISLAGCGQSAVRSEFYQHDSLYKNWDHTKFSWFGYKNPTAEDLQKTIDQQWWGLEVPYVPGQ